MKKTSFFRKVTACFVGALTTAALLLVLGNSGTLAWFPPVLVFSLVGVSLLSAISYPFVWQQLERRQKVDSQKVYSFLNAVIIYTIAFNLATFGWKKILGLQFIVPEEIARQPMNQQSGEWLTWYYFGYSTAFGLILASIQLVGAYFLLFRRTVLLAAIALFAFMLNLMLINVFYRVNAGALTQSVLLTIGLSYLILSDYQRLKNFFLNSLPAISLPVLEQPISKNMLRIVMLTGSLLFVLYLKIVAK